MKSYLDGQYYVMTVLWEHGFYFFCLDPKLVPKIGNLKFGNSKIRETG
jgi:hypothetical protein